jgi:hypothetical protein
MEKKKGLCHTTETQNPKAMKKKTFYFELTCLANFDFKLAALFL